jgi:hypothetical protein
VGGRKARKKRQWLCSGVMPECIMNRWTDILTSFTYVRM